MSAPARIVNLRRQIRKDPSSTVFAQLAEELRKSGQHQQAVDLCISGLTAHPTYLSARVILGRALLDLGEVAEARAELEAVVRRAPHNLTALRALAEAHRRNGTLAEAGRYSAAAAALGRNDSQPAIALAGRSIKSRQSGLPAAQPLAASSVSSGAHVSAPPAGDPSEQLPAQRSPESPVPSAARPAERTAARAAAQLSERPAPRPSAGADAQLSARLSAAAVARSAAQPLQSAAIPADSARDQARRTVAALEGWLAAIHVTRLDQHP